MMEKFKDYKNRWEESYARGENNILYPQAEVIRFINRYICKLNNDKSVKQIIKTKDNRRISGLDFACGVGTHCITFNDFGIEAYGVDISSNAIEQAKTNGLLKGVSAHRFIQLEASEQALPFEDNFFDFVVAESCLDSMPLVVAKNYMNELKRVCNGLIYASFIGTDDNMVAEEFEVVTIHEQGTYQTVFDENKISYLFGAEISDFSYLSSVASMDVAKNEITNKRYYCVIESHKLTS